MVSFAVSFYKSSGVHSVHDPSERPQALQNTFFIFFLTMTSTLQMVDLTTLLTCAKCFR
jgi:hypothetical protein